MDYASVIGMLILVNVIAWLTPGPNMISVMSSSMEHGRRHGIMTGMGLATGAFLWSALAVLGVTIMFDLFPRAVLVLKLLGAAYLIWLGLKSMHSAITTDSKLDLGRPAPRRLSRSFLIGFVVSMTNPKAALFLGSVVTAFVPAEATGAFLIGVAGLCGGLAVLLHSITATVFSTQVAMRVFRRARRLISGAFGVIFIGLGGVVAHAALRRS